MIYETTTTSPDATFTLGEQLAKPLRGGEVIELASDLGGGKTVLVKGLAKGLGYDGDVASPTFTISREYQVRDGLQLHHYDFYRLGEGDIVADELAEDVADPQIITAVEWAGTAGNALPAARVRISIQPTGDTERSIKVESLGEKFNYVIEALKI
jgi:tRNA threonylcarbamoyladenosine biosynthesis protein TsaE